uniref:Protein kinase domain-containing protein n=1 Tax=Graphocephala atropunctata TaxID=36148 RepID=A0A1B6KVV7_9HEMI
MALMNKEHNLRDKQYAESASGLLQRNGYKLGRTIGEGSYCKVRVAVKFFGNGHGLKLACKLISKKRASVDYVTRFLPREISIIRNLQHPNISQVYDILESQDHVFIFMNLCERGDLLEYIKRRGALVEFKARVFFRQLVSAILYLHSQDISHRDLKCENIFITANDDVVLGDFGFARRCRDPYTQKRILSETFCGSAAYAAPEILQGVAYNPKMYDVWSQGCILYIMLTGSMPFDDTNVLEMLRLQLARQFETRRFNLRASAEKLIFHMLEPDVTRRATATQIAQSQWLREPFHNHPHPITPANYASLG